jgi:hypothetical protein
MKILKLYIDKHEGGQFNYIIYFGTEEVQV